MSSVFSEAEGGIQLIWTAVMHDRLDVLESQLRSPSHPGFERLVFTPNEFQVHPDLDAHRPSLRLRPDSRAPPFFSGGRRRQMYISSVLHGCLPKCFG